MSCVADAKATTTAMAISQDKCFCGSQKPIPIRPRITSAWESTSQERRRPSLPRKGRRHWSRSEEHTSELQSQSNLVCRLLLAKQYSSCLSISDNRSLENFSLSKNKQHLE